MKKEEALHRWLDAKFVAHARPTLEQVFRQKQGSGKYDVRGVTIGLDGSPSDFESADLIDANLANVDAAYAVFSCSFGRVRLRNCNFQDASFDTCTFRGASIQLCEFIGANINSPVFDDAVFEGCHFDSAKIIGRRSREYGGRRMKFVHCTFRKTTFQNLQLRAASFENCAFDLTAFKKCLLAGVRFQGAVPDSGSFDGCEIQSVSFNGKKSDNP